jgi:hypothetical protein
MFREEQKNFDELATQLAGGGLLTSSISQNLTEV